MGVKISNLPAIVTPALTDVIAVVQDGTTFKETITQLATLFPALANYEEGTWTPILTLVGGAGNTVPIYTTNVGVYTRIGNIVYCSVLFEGDGGAEGAGTGNINISLPLPASLSTGNIGFVSVNGNYLNNMTLGQVGIAISAGATTGSLFYWTSLTAYAQLSG